MCEGRSSRGCNICQDTVCLTYLRMSSIISRIREILQETRGYDQEEGYSLLESQREIVRSAPARGPRSSERQALSQLTGVSAGNSEKRSSERTTGVLFCVVIVAALIQKYTRTRLILFLPLRLAFCFEGSAALARSVSGSSISSSSCSSQSAGLFSSISNNY